MTHRDTRNAPTKSTASNARGTTNWPVADCSASMEGTRITAARFPNNCRYPTETPAYCGPVTSADMVRTIGNVDSRKKPSTMILIIFAV